MTLHKEALELSDQQSDHLCQKDKLNEKFEDLEKFVLYKQCHNQSFLGAYWYV